MTGITDFPCPNDYIEIIEVPTGAPELEVGVLGWVHAGYLVRDW